MPAWGCLVAAMAWRAVGPMHGGVLVESGFGPGALRFQGRYHTTSPPRPLCNSKFRGISKLLSATLCFSLLLELWHFLVKMNFYSHGPYYPPDIKKKNMMTAKIG
ncbi:hypothetical protein AVEN_91468-1 [Araneus ventricosus]|uniref:Secreted protein n=1 Tax=Araneus ventricosus TaxID=182803 RepID=A0A4Y2BLQ2_ARAVE|nr:hypothetical protein AVEN_91468-1 [Araneus ventricosus]